MKKEKEYSSSFRKYPYFLVVGRPARGDYRFGSLSKLRPSPSYTTCFGTTKVRLKINCRADKIISLGGR
jgi:hypothetical protein